MTTSGAQQISWASQPMAQRFMTRARLCLRVPSARGGNLAPHGGDQLICWDRASRGHGQASDARGVRPRLHDDMAVLEPGGTLRRHQRRKTHRCNSRRERCTRALPGGGIPARAQRSPKGEASTCLGVSRARNAVSTRGHQPTQPSGAAKPRAQQARCPKPPGSPLPRPRHGTPAT
jgi:hypothetical protein